MNFMSELVKFAKWEKYLASNMGLLIVIVVILYFISMLSSRQMNKTLLIIYLMVILYMTILNRDPHSTRNAWLQIFTTYRHFFNIEYLRREILNNIILFIPLGTITARLWSRWRMVIVPVTVSAAIELLQFITKRGWMETDDVISNSLGGLIGFTAVMLWLYAESALRKNQTQKNNEH